MNYLPALHHDRVFAITFEFSCVSPSIFYASIKPPPITSLSDSLILQIFETSDEPLIHFQGAISEITEVDFTIIHNLIVVKLQMAVSLEKEEEFLID